MKDKKSKPEESKQEAEHGETRRTRERHREDEEFVPVILKRTDEAVRHPDDILQSAVNEGLQQLSRPWLSLALSSVAAGLIICFTALPVAVLASFIDPQNDPLLARLAPSLVYPIGFILCILSRTQLFTEQTATALYPVLDRRAEFLSVFRLWGVVIIGNLLGAIASAGLLVIADSVIQAKSGYLITAGHLMEADNPGMLISAILAGWLMALGGWLVLATPASISQIFCLYLVTFLIGIAGLHHSIAGAVEIFTAALISDLYSLPHALRFVGIALAGNLIGGSIFVALLNYGHIRETQTTQ